VIIVHHRTYALRVARYSWKVILIKGICIELKSICMHITQGIMKVDVFLMHGARALNTICLCLVDKVLFNIVEEETTTCLWNKLESLYMAKSLMNIIFLKRQLYNLRMKEGTKIVDHLNVFNTLICQLSSMDGMYEDEDKVVTQLYSFPESWDHLVTSMWFNSTYAIDYNNVVGDLLSEEMRKRSSKETSTSEAMAVRGRSTKGGKDQKRYN
jgi:hypothetical protein